MLWIILAWTTSLIAIFLFGRYIGNIAKHITELEEVVKSKVDTKPVIEEPSSEVIDPYDPVQTAIYEHSKMMEKINPK